MRTFNVEITSRDNRLIKEYRRLSEEARFRRESGRFAVEGARLCADAALTGVTIPAAFLTSRAREQYPELVAPLLDAARVVYDVPESLSQHLADTNSPQGVFCIAALPSHPKTVEDLPSEGRFAALEMIQDPGNLGTMIRTAEAFGLSGLLLSDGCCDPYSPKVLRASMGGVFRLPLYAAGDLTQTLPSLAQRGFRPSACVVDAAAQSVQTAGLCECAVPVIGNEGNGLRPETVAACAQRITIPMSGRAESLNASMAAGIIFWEMVRKDGTAHE
ncbi:MAG: RNA methyltransferase [Clostridia bacterium]|nr:RNA methyltransferase [Clostridia bacterium]